MYYKLNPRGMSIPWGAWGVRSVRNVGPRIETVLQMDKPKQEAYLIRGFVPPETVDEWSDANVNKLSSEQKSDPIATRRKLMGSFLRNQMGSILDFFSVDYDFAMNEVKKEEFPRWHKDGINNSNDVVMLVYHQQVSGEQVSDVFRGTDYTILENGEVCGGNHDPIEPLITVRKGDAMVHSATTCHRSPPTEEGEHRWVWLFNFKPNPEAFEELKTRKLASTTRLFVKILVESSDASKKPKMPPYSDVFWGVGNGGVARSREEEEVARSACRACPGVPKDEKEAHTYMVDLLTQNMKVFISHEEGLQRSMALMRAALAVSAYAIDQADISFIENNIGDITGASEVTEEGEQKAEEVTLEELHKWLQSFQDRQQFVETALGFLDKRMKGVGMISRGTCVELVLPAFFAVFMRPIGKHLQLVGTCIDQALSDAFMFFKSLPSEAWGAARVVIQGDHFEFCVDQPFVGYTYYNKYIETKHIVTQNLGEVFLWLVFSALPRLLLPQVDAYPSNTRSQGSGPIIARRRRICPLVAAMETQTDTPFYNKLIARTSPTLPHLSP